MEQMGKQPKSRLKEAGILVDNLKIRRVNAFFSSFKITLVDYYSNKKN